MSLRLKSVPILLVLAALAIAALSSAVASGKTSEAELDAQGQAVAARLRCPVCQNESVADSPAELAAQMRAVIRRKLDAGETPDQIIAYFVDRYGEWILLEPPRRGLLWMVWLAPAGTLAIGLLLAWSFLRRVTKQGKGQAGPSATGVRIES